MSFDGGSTMMRTPLMLSTLMDRGAQLQPDETIVTKVANGYHEITYREHQRRVYKLASALSKFGVQQGDRIGSFCWNTARHYQLYHAVPSMGAVLHTLNIRLGPTDLSYILNHAGDSVVVVDADLLPALEKVPHSELSGVKLFIVCGTDEQPGGWRSTLPRTVDWDAFLATGDDFFSWPEVDENQIMGLCYTSGTTGRPKGVAYSHRSTYLHTITSCLPDALGLSVVDVVLAVVPMFHAMSWGVPFITLMLGCRICHLNRFLAPQPTLEFFTDYGVTFSSGVPVIWQGVRQILTANPNLGKGLKLTRLTCGGSAPAAEMMRWFLNMYKIEFVQGWGMTETNPLATLSKLVGKSSDVSKSLDEQFSNVEKAGLLLPGLQMKIVDLDDFDKELPRDGVAQGELLLKGPWITGAYYRNPDSKNKFHRGWLTTGDIASIDLEGYLIIRDRSKDVIKSGGEWISSIDMENHIAALPGVAMAAVVAQPHPKWDERPVAIVMKQPNSTITKDAVIEHCKSAFAKFQLPDDVLFWDSIPLGATGKMSKKDIRELLKAQKYVLPDLAKL
eukprot:m.14018 g.14018  ORF g.14018 m.14018 type:complete len:560 (-) comp4738_c0_seq1:180-1859(-)